MKIKTTPKFNLVVEGKDNWESTDEFNKKVNEIKRLARLVDRKKLVQAPFHQDSPLA
jgi:hypothetical protein